MSSKQISGHYNHRDIEGKIIQMWLSTALYKTKEISESQSKYYSLYSFPYPSGAGLHVGHAEGMIANDVMARWHRMKGDQVMLPMGWDSFGLPAENYAIKTGVHPQDSTEEAIATFIKQINKLGLGVDWDREVGAHRSDYYKWTQWFFTQFYKYGLAYKAKAPVNWCPKDQTVLANEQVVDGKCERCDAEIEQKEMDQWFFRITHYAERLATELEEVDWPASTKQQQRNWIGKSEGAIVKFKLETNKGKQKDIEVFTTRADTLFGATFLVIAPEHTIISDLSDQIENYKEVEVYLHTSINKTHLERTDLNKEKSGLLLQGINAINPVNQKKIPVYVADYVLVDYGTGAIMAVPAHDKRDYEFAKKHEINIIEVIEFDKLDTNEEFYSGEGKMKNSGEYNGLSSREFRRCIIEKLSNDGVAQIETKYKLRDWLISRQRYWGAPIPIIWKIRENANKILIVPGITNEIGQEHWYKWLSNQECIKSCAEILDYNEQDSLTDCTAQILSKGLDKHSCLIAHSLGCKIALKYAESNALKQLICVAPSSVVLDQVDIESICKNVQEIVLICSTNDPYTPLTEVKKFEKIWKQYTNVEFRYYMDKENFIGVEFPELLDYFGERQYRALREEDLPLLLPHDVDFIPKGYSPLSRSEEYGRKIKEKYGSEWTPEFDTMDTFVCSSWYFFRFVDPANKDKFAESEKLDKWIPVDLYMIGAEHIVLHLLYARFFTKFLFDLGLIRHREPFKKMRHMGIILGPDNRKMSKRWGNVINPNDVVDAYGADTLRLYEMFMGPLDQSKAWNDSSVKGVRRFIDRVYALARQKESLDETGSAPSQIALQQLIKNVTEDTQKLDFNTAVSEFMKFLNKTEKEGLANRELEEFLKVLAPYAPFVTEHIWQDILGHKDSIHIQQWPEFNQNLLLEQKIAIAVQIMGKTRMVLECNPEITQEQLLKLAQGNEKLDKYFKDGYKRVIYVKGKIINFVL